MYYKPAERKTQRACVIMRQSRIQPDLRGAADGGHPRKRIPDPDGIPVPTPHSSLFRRSIFLRMSSAEQDARGYGRCGRCGRDGVPDDGTAFVRL